MDLHVDPHLCRRLDHRVRDHRVGLTDWTPGLEHLELVCSPELTDVSIVVEGVEEDVTLSLQMELLSTHLVRPHSVKRHPKRRQRQY